MRERNDELAQYLLGTCMTVSEACEQLGIDESEDAEDMLLESEVECCSTCGWWHESGEMRSDGECLDCGGEEDDE